MTTDCLFCKIVAGEIPSTRVDEDERTVTFMDINPATRGHALVIPREHYRDLHDVPAEELGSAAAARVASYSQQATRWSAASAAIRIAAGEEPTGDEPLMGIFEWALERLSSDQQGGR